jgi:pimeloyl-ACP methyl ester carboxylesterase
MQFPGLTAALVLLAAPAAAAAAGAGRWATVNGHRLYYEIHGSGRPILLLHGGGNSIEGSWKRQIVDFSPTREVIAPEQVGNGHTPDLPGPYSYGRMTEDTAALLEQLHRRNVDVVGWSDGGIIALMLALRHPELVRRVVASGPNTTPDELPPSWRADRDQELRASPGDRLTLLWRDFPARDELSLPLLGRIHARVLVMGGDHDMIPLEHLVQIFHALPDAQLWILPHTGHGTFLERPEWTDPYVLSFLQ